jgi:hypothetical protein
MRPPQKNRGNRNKGGRGGGGHKPMGNVQNRVFESAGPEGKVRGTPQQIIDKYLILARDAQTSGDRVGAENFLQHAEHYIRLLNTAQGQFDERRQQPFPGRSEYDDATEGDEDDDGSADGVRDGADMADTPEGRSEAEPRRAEGRSQPEGEGRRAEGRSQPEGEGRRGEGQRRRDDRGPRREPRAEPSDENREATAAEPVAVVVPAAASALETIEAPEDADGGLVATPESRAEEEPAVKKRAPRRRRRPAGEGDEAAASEAADAPEAQAS